MSVVAMFDMLVLEISAVEVVDWTLDGFVLVVCLLVAKRVLGFSVRELLMLVGCMVFYVLHEMWESGLIGGSTHREFELWIVALF